MDQSERVRLLSARERARKGGTGGIDDDCLAAAHFMIDNQTTLSKWRRMQVDLLLDVSAKLAPINSEIRAAAVDRRRDRDAINSEIRAAAVDRS